uniref:Thioredoxin domain-containing protein n=1 Tax=Salix viminalis TaxID=40686 RepID=A0A6N2KEP8_SALVM
MQAFFSIGEDQLCAVKESVLLHLYARLLKVIGHIPLLHLCYGGEDFSVWWNAFEVESAPAIAFVKDSGVKPVVVHGLVNNSEFLDLVEKNKQQGHSRAGNDTISWYCVILAGRLGPELNKMREKYCSYYIHSETSYDTCGPRRDLVDVPKLFIVRYKRNASEDVIKVDTKPKNIFNVFEDENMDPASQLVARYNGSDEISQRSKTLPSEDSDPIWSRGAQSIFSKSIGIKQRIYNNFSRIYDYLGDPRIGPILLLGALMSFGTIWLIRSQSTHPKASQPSQSNAKYGWAQDGAGGDGRGSEVVDGSGAVVD